MLIFNNLNAHYGNQIIFTTDKIIIPEGKITLIRGESGSGKSTFLYRVGLISDDSQYSFLYHGENVNELSKNERSEFRRQHISFVLQDNSLFEQYNVHGNLDLYARFSGIRYSEDEYYTFLKQVNLNVSFTQSVQTLSGGERQRLAVACALCQNTDILVLDEPTGFLDNENEVHLFRVLKSICEIDGKTVILSSHSPNAVAIADQIYEIQDQKILSIKNSSDKDKNTIEKGCVEFDRKSFINGYFSYFIKKYKIIEQGITFILTIMLFLTHFLVFQTDKNTIKSSEELKSICDNQLYITVDDDFHFEYENGTTGAKIYPFIKTSIIIAGIRYPVIPLFNQNDISDSVLMSYGNGDIYLGYECYRFLNDQKINPVNAQIEIYAEWNGEQYTLNNASLHICGLLKKNTETKYLPSGEQSFVYCRYESLEKLYKQAGLEGKNRYIGYTIFTDNYENYVSLNKKLENSYHVTLFFPFQEELGKLLQTNNNIKMEIFSIGYVTAYMLFVLLEIQYIRKRDKEIVLLSINGADDELIDKVIGRSINIHSLTAYGLNIISIMIIKRVLSLDSERYFWVFTSVHFLAWYAILLIRKRIIKIFSLEKVLRDT